jgi:hypothetical protein
MFLERAFFYFFVLVRPLNSATILIVVVIYTLVQNFDILFLFFTTNDVVCFFIRLFLMVFESIIKAL